MFSKKVQKLVIELVVTLAVEQAASYMKQKHQERIRRDPFERYFPIRNQPGDGAHLRDLMNPDKRRWR